MTCMSEARSLYRINDKDPGQGCHAVENFNEAGEWNKRGWGIFWTVNSFSGPRKKENCTRVLAWAIDLDAGTKDEQLARIRSVPVTPSALVETSRGYHVYFDAKSGDQENYRDIVERLVEKYNGDKNAKDICRILRVPAFLHWKGEKPFGIKLAYSSTQVYTEDEMRRAFPAPEPIERVFEQKTELRRELKVSGNGDLWEKIWSLDCEYALQRLSGSAAVNYEQFTFKPTTGGKLNIFVNGKGTSCWIDTNKRIGSLDKGGPTIFNWVNWYQRNNRKTVEAIKQMFPEVCA